MLYCEEKLSWKSVGTAMLSVVWTVVDILYGMEMDAYNNNEAMSR